MDAKLPVMLLDDVGVARVRTESGVTVQTLEHDLLGENVIFHFGIRDEPMELEESQHEVVVLPSVFEWVQANQARGQRTWPAPLVVKKLIEIMQRLWKSQSSLLKS